MTTTKEDVLWTIKVGKKLDAAVQKSLNLLGYKSKAELVREAIREFLIHRKLFALLGGEPSIPLSPQLSPEDALSRLVSLLKDILPEIIAQEVETAREEVAREFLEESEE